MQSRRIPAAPVSKPSDLYADEHLKAREFFVPLPARDAGSRSRFSRPGAPFKSTGMGWTMGSPAPRLGEHNREILADGAARSTRATPAPPERRIRRIPSRSLGPLHGVRVLDF